MGCRVEGSVFIRFALSLLTRISYKGIDNDFGLERFLGEEDMTKNKSRSQAHLFHTWASEHLNEHT